MPTPLNCYVLRETNLSNPASQFDFFGTRHPLCFLNPGPPSYYPIAPYVATQCYAPPPYGGTAYHEPAQRGSCQPSQLFYPSVAYPEPAFYPQLMHCQTPPYAYLPSQLTYSNIPNLPPWGGLPHPQFQVTTAQRSTYALPTYALPTYAPLTYQQTSLSLPFYPIFTCPPSQPPEVHDPSSFNHPLVSPPPTFDISQHSQQTVFHNVSIDGSHDQMCKDVSTAQVQLGILTATAGLISIPYGKIPSGIKTVVGSEGFTLRDSKLIVTLHDQTHYVVGESLVLENPPTYTYLLIPDTDTRRLHQIRALDQQFPNGPKPKQYVDSFLKILSPVYSDVPSISQWDVPPDYPTSPAQMTAQSPQSSSEVSRYIHPIGGVGDCFPESITRALLDDPEGVAYLKELAAEFGQPNLSDDKLVGFGTTYFRKQISQNLPSIDKVLTSHHCSLILSALNNDEDTLAEVLKGILPDSIADHLVSLLIQNKALFNPDLNPDKETLMRVFNDGLPEGVVSIDEWRKSEVGTAGVSIGVIDLNSDFISHETCRIVHEGCPGTTQYKLTIKVGDKPIVIFVSYHGGHYNPILKLTPSP